MRSSRSIILLVVLLVSLIGSSTAVVTHNTTAGTASLCSGCSGPITVSLSGMANGDVLVGMVAGRLFNSALDPTYTASTGWIPLCTLGWGATFYKVWHTGDSTSVTFTPDPTVDSLGKIARVEAYSGADQTRPVDVFGCHLQGNSHWTSPLSLVAPGLSPMWSNEFSIIINYSANMTGTVSFSGPASYTTRATDFGPLGSGIWGEAQLSGSANTGVVQTLFTSGSVSGQAATTNMQLLLKPAVASGATTATVPIVGGTELELPGGGCGSVNFITPKNSDLITVTIFGATAGFGSTGWNTFISNSNYTVLYRIWHTGDSLSMSCFAGASFWFTYYRNPRFSDGSSPDIGRLCAIDATEYQSTASTATLTLPSMTLASTAEVLAAQWLDATAGPAFTTVSGMVLDDASHTWISSGSASNDSTVSTETVAPANPTGTFTITNTRTGTDTLFGAMEAIKLGVSNSLVRHRLQMIDQF